MRDSNLKPVFDSYVKSAMQLENDVKFWKSFLDSAIKRYQTENQENRWIFQSGFAVYDFRPHQIDDTWLYFTNDTFEIQITDLHIHNTDFFDWIMSLSIVRIYNSLELLLLQAIQRQCFAELQDPMKGKQEATAVSYAIKSALKEKGLKADAKNNRHLLDYISLRSTAFAEFLNCRVNINFTSTWRQFYELFSILRNVVAHDAMVMSSDVENSIKSQARDIYEHYFRSSGLNSELRRLASKDAHTFCTYLFSINEFAINTLKFLAGETDLTFLGLERVVIPDGFSS